MAGYSRRCEMRCSSSSRKVFEFSRPCHATAFVLLLKDFSTWRLSLDEYQKFLILLSFMTMSIQILHKPLCDCCRLTRNRK